ncbi:glycosyltransferase family 4 protein [Hoeflea sp. BAL378]|uniref:glycosyltransferase family 4 protein n=1 Tax=Hoeflea sp. BAL378 TaxID=1547437 RepID=UPI0009DD7EC1|nr:glycosyltransferase family 4 protein [Hoeflea sp. BAL378]
MIRICLHTAWSVPANFIGGTERFLIELAKELKVLGFDPFVVCSNLQRELDIEGVEVRGRIPAEFQTHYRKTDPNIAAFMKDAVYNQEASKGAFRHISTYVQKQIEDVEADLFHFNAFSAALYVKTEVPQVVTNHENARELEGFWHHGAFETMGQLVRSDPDAFPSSPLLFTPSRFYSEEYSNAFSRQVRANHLGVNLENFAPVKVRPKSERQYTVLLPSRFFPAQKGQDVALRACRILRDKGHSNFSFLFTGVRDYYGDMVESFRQEARELGIADAIRIKNFSRMQDAFEEADIVISPERYCSYGLSVSEALASGKALVLSEIPTYLEIASTFQHATFVAVDDAEGLANAILRCSATRENHQLDMIRFRLKNDFRDCAKRYANAYLQLLRI